MNNELGIILESTNKIFNKYINHELRQDISNKNENLIKER